MRHTLAHWRSLELSRKFSLIAYFLSVFPYCKLKFRVCIICRHNVNIGMQISNHAVIKTPPKVEILGKSTCKGWDGHRNRTTQLDVVLKNDCEIYHLHSYSLSHSAFSSLCYSKHHVKLLSKYQTVIGLGVIPIAVLILEWNSCFILTFDVVMGLCADMCWLSP